METIEKDLRRSLDDLAIELRDEGLIDEAKYFLFIDFNNEQSVRNSTDCAEYLTRMGIAEAATAKAILEQVLLVHEALSKVATILLLVEEREHDI